MIKVYLTTEDDVRYYFMNFVNTKKENAPAYNRPLPDKVPPCGRLLCEAETREQAFHAMTELMKANSLDLQYTFTRKCKFGLYVAFYDEVKIYDREKCKYKWDFTPSYYLPTGIVMDFMLVSDSEEGNSCC